MFRSLRAVISLAWTHCTLSPSDAVTEQIKAHPDVQNVQLTSLGGGRAKGSLVTKKCFACRTIMESDCFLRGAQTKEDGTVEWDIVLTSEGALALLSEKLQSIGCRVKVLRLATVEDDTAMTMRQEEIVRKAFEMGYYDYPRRTTVREMAAQMKVAPSTLTEILQRGSATSSRGTFARANEKLTELYISCLHIPDGPTG